MTKTFIVQDNSPSDSPTLKGWINLIDNYKIGAKEQKKATKGGLHSVPFNDEELLEKLNEEQRHILFGDKQDEQGNWQEAEQKQTARAAFLKHLHGVLEKTDNNVDPAKKQKVSAENFLDEDGLRLYKAAVEEENNSHEFRKAVFCRSTTKYSGRKWAKKLVLWVGGPAAAGKTFGSENALGKLVRKLTKADQSFLADNEDGNFVVFVDGAKEREMSQMRKMLLQVAQQKGYKGVKDLHEKTKLTVKYAIQKTASKNPDLNIVIPETFTSRLCKKIMKEYARDPNIVQAFSQVETIARYFKQLKNTVFLMGNDRAWRRTPSVLDKNEIHMNNPDVEGESKKYPADNFKWGVLASNIAKMQYFRIMKKVGKEPIYFSIRQELIYVKKNKKGEWKRCSGKKQEIDNLDRVLIARRDFRNFKKYQKGEMQAPPKATDQEKGYVTELNKDSEKKDLSDWIKYCKEKGLLHKQVIKTSTYEKEVKEINLLDALSKELTGKSFKELSKKGVHHFRKTFRSQRRSMKDPAPNVQIPKALVFSDPTKPLAPILANSISTPPPKPPDSTRPLPERSAQLFSNFRHADTPEAPPKPAQITETPPPKPVRKKPS